MWFTGQDCIFSMDSALTDTGRLGQMLWQYYVGAWQSGGFCKGMELAHQGRSVINKATLFSS